MKTTSINIDHHVYFDETYYDLQSFKNLFKKNGIKKVIFSPPCTKYREPEKSSLMYFIQRRLLMNYFGRMFCALISKSFYNNKDELRSFWKLFSGKNSLIKIIYPDNESLYNKIEHQDNFEMWYWINPNKIKPYEVSSEINKYSKKIFGLKFHQYWHSFNLKMIDEYVKIALINKLPIYLILSYTNKREILNIISKYPNVNFIFGYGGFPLFKSFWKEINKHNNCFIDVASNHIDKDIIKNIVSKININRILFATDCPYNFKNEKDDFDYGLFYNGLSKLTTAEQIKIINNKIK